MRFMWMGCNLGYILDDSGTYDCKCCRKVASGRKVAGAIRSMINAMGVHLQCARVLYEGLLRPVLLYGSGTMIWREKERSRFRAEQMDKLKRFARY